MHKKLTIILFLIIFSLINSFENKCRTFDYYFEENKIYLNNTKFFENADLTTFISLGSKYAKDKNYVYYEGLIIKDADSKTFEKLIFDQLFGCTINLYAKDKNHIYYKEKKLKNVDILTFKVLSIDYAKDKNYIYYKNKKIGKNDFYSEKNNDSLKVIDDLQSQKNIEVYGNYLIMKNKTYYKGTEIKKINSSNIKYIPGIEKTLTIHLGDEYFQIDKIEIDYIKDDQYVYYQDKIIKNADVETIEYIPGIQKHYLKDKNHVYYKGKKLENIDPKTFDVIEYDNKRK